MDYKNALRCSFCKTPWVAANVHTGDLLIDGQNVFNACNKKECQEKIGEVIKKIQEINRAANPPQPKK